MVSSFNGACEKCTILLIVNFYPLGYIIGSYSILPNRKRGIAQVFEI